MANVTKAKLKSDSAGYALLSVPSLGSDITYLLPPAAGSLASPDFTTGEIDTGRKWVDGKTIYQKIISFGALPNNTSKSVAHNISGYTYFHTIRGIGYVSTTWITLPDANTDPAVGSTYIYVSGANVIVGTRSDRSGISAAYVLLEYTK